jgi:hypothetical protein
MQRILKRALISVALSGFATLAGAQSVSQPYNGLSNGIVPPFMPMSIYVGRVPYGSGAPQPGIDSGYERAEYVGGGLYHTPGFLPFNSNGESMQARVIRVTCHLQEKAWYCGGYSIPADLGPQEYVLVQPVFQR